MTELESAIALIEALTERQIFDERPAVRRRLALACLRAAEMAEPGPIEIDQPRSGILYALKSGERNL
jgi:hypothetical protein